MRENRRNFILPMVKPEFGIFLKIVKQGEGPNKNDKCYLSAIKANEEAEVIAIKLFIKNAIQQGCASTNIL